MVYGTQDSGFHADVSDSSINFHFLFCWKLVRASLEYDNICVLKLAGAFGGFFPTRVNDAITEKYTKVGHQGNGYTSKEGSCGKKKFRLPGQ